MTQEQECKHHWKRDNDPNSNTYLLMMCTKCGIGMVESDIED